MPFSRNIVIVKKEDITYFIIMNKERIKDLILDSREQLGKRRFVQRDIHLDYQFLVDTGKIAAIVGPRRSGKSVLLLQVQKETKTPPEQCVWIDFSEIPWSDFGPEDWETLWRASLELGAGDHPLFLLDEIQECPDFEAGLKYLQNRRARIFVTGSNAEVFSEGLATTIRGKVLPYDLFPLSFVEFLRFKGVSYPENLSTREKAERSTLMDEYLSWGGFPEVVLADREDLKRNLIDSYWDVMLFRDVIERHRLKNFALVEKILRKILLSFTKEGSINRWYNDLKSQGFKTGKDSLYEYLGYFEKALFVHTIPNAAAGAGIRKVYLVDNGLYQKAKDRPDRGKLWENLCFVDLLRSGKRPRFWKTQEGEIDFVTDDELIQVTTELTSENRAREEQPFKAALPFFPAHRTRILELP